MKFDNKKLREPVIEIKKLKLKPKMEVINLSIEKFDYLGQKQDIQNINVKESNNQDMIRFDNSDNTL